MANEYMKMLNIAHTQRNANQTTMRLPQIIVNGYCKTTKQ